MTVWQETTPEDLAAWQARREAFIKDLNAAMQKHGCAMNCITEDGKGHPFPSLQVYTLKDPTKQKWEFRTGSKEGHFDCKFQKTKEPSP